MKRASAKLMESMDISIPGSITQNHYLQARLSEANQPEFSAKSLVSWSLAMASAELIPQKSSLLMIEILNEWRKLFNDGGVHLWEGKERKFKPNDKDVWWQMIQLLPSSYNQKRTVMLNYEVLTNIYQHRRNHKLDEWRELCKWIEELPYSEIITCNTVKEGD